MDHFNHQSSSYSGEKWCLTDLSNIKVEMSSGSDTLYVQFFMFSVLRSMRVI